MRRFAARNNLVLRKSSVISKGRAVVSKENLDLWFSDVGNFLTSKADLMVALKDPRRVFNQDETAVELGVGAQWVLVEKNTKQVYTVSSNTREHITAFYTVNTSSGMVPPCAVFSDKRNITKVKQASMPNDGMSGEWGFSYSENGWVTKEVYIDIVKDHGIFIQK